MKILVCMHTIFDKNCFYLRYACDNKEKKCRHKKTLSHIERVWRRGDEWARTTDSRIFSPMLYQLSYITAVSGCKGR